MQGYLTDERYEQVKRRGLPASELLHEAARAELGTEVGEPDSAELACAESIVRRIGRRTRRRS